MCKLWPVNLPDSLHFSSKFLSTVPYNSACPAQILDFLEFCLALQLITGRGNTKMSCMESVMSCGARDNIDEVSTSFITHTNFKWTVICSHSRVVKLQPCLFSPSPQNLLIWLSCGLASTLFLLHILLQLFGVVCNLGNDWAASNLGSRDRLIIVNKGNAKGFSWGGCVGTGCFTKTLHNKIFSVTSWFWIKKKKDLNQCCFSIFLPLCVILVFAELDLNTLSSTLFCKHNFWKNTINLITVISGP